MIITQKRLQRNISLQPNYYNDIYTLPIIYLVMMLDYNPLNLPALLRCIFANSSVSALTLSCAIPLHIPSKAFNKFSENFKRVADYLRL